MNGDIIVGRDRIRELASMSDNTLSVVEVKDAKLENGLLRIELALELPEAMKPRQISGILFNCS